MLNDLDINLTEEVLTQLDIEDALAADFGTLSLNAIPGTDDGEVMRLRALVKNKVMLMLVDSGSSHCFVSSTFLKKLGIQPIPAPPKTVKVANGEVLISDQMVPQLEWWIQGHTFSCDMRVLDIAAYDCILGYDWPKLNSPITHHWEHKTMEFMYKGQLVTIKGVNSNNLAVQELSADKLLKWDAGNDIWAFAIVKVLPDQAGPSVLEEIQEVLDEFKDAFTEPKELPPSRVYDHPIPITPGAIPVNSKPYRYSPSHKNEIER